MKNNLRFMITMLSLVFCLTATVAFGQETTGNIEGTIKDPTGAVVPNVSVTVQNLTSSTDASGTTTTGTSQGFNRTVTADGDGFFRVIQVPPGVYVVSTAATGGFGTYRNENVQVVLGRTTQLNVELGAAGGTNVVDITSSDQPVDTTDNEISTSVNAQKIELLPKGVNFTSVLRASPGTRPEAASGGFTIDGASGSENVFVIDGQEVTNYRTGTLNANNNIPTQFVQEVQVKSSGFDAEFGGATGGVISVVTKGGSNDFRGEFGAQFNTPNLNGSPRPLLQRFTSGSGAHFTQTVEYITQPKAQGTTFYPTANLSGPIVKDRLWFFGSYSPTIETTRVNTTFFTNAPAATRSITATEEFRRNRTFEYAFARLDAQPVSNLRLSGTYTWNPIVDQGAIPTITALNPIGTVSLGGAPPVTNFGGNIGTLSGSELTNRQGGRQNSNNVTGQVVWTPTSNLVFSGRYSRGFLNEKLGNYFVPTGSRVRCQQGSTTIHGACQTGFLDPIVAQTIRDVSIRTNYEVDGTFLFNGLGRHELKGGYQRFKVLNDVNRTTTGEGFIDLYYGTSCPDLGAPITSTPGAIGCGELIRFATVGVGQNTNQSIYVQDKWQPFNRLTLNLGLRAEKEDLPSFNGLAPPINFGFGDKLAPRLGFAFDLFGNGRSKIFGSYGQFYDRLKFELPRGSFGGDFYRIDFFEIFPNSGNFRNFTPASILGSFNDASGGRCPQTGFITSGALSRCQFDYRIASNSPEATIFTGAVDPNLKPFRQDEFTVGMEHQLASDYVVRGRYTRKEVKSAIEDAGIRNNEGSEAYIIGNPGTGLHLELLNQLGYTRAATPQRQYDAFELTLEKRLSNNYYFNVNYTLSRLYGNYSGLASSDELTSGAGRTSPGVNRFFDLPFIGFTATGETDNGRLATDRPHVFNAFGAYIFDWFGNKTNSTEFSFFQTVQSGTPQSTLINFIVPIFETRRGDLGRTPRFSQTDIAVSHKYRFGRDARFTLVGDLNILNLLDQDTVLGLQTVRTGVTLSPSTFGLSEIAGANAFTSGALASQINTYLQGTSTALNRTRTDFGQPNVFQSPRSVRFGFRLLF